MGYLGRALFGAALGIGAFAAAPFTGGGSIFAGASLAASLMGAEAAAVGGAVLGAVSQGMDDAEDERIRNAKESSYRDGLNEGRNLSVGEVKKFVDFCLATTALSYYMARCDGYISEEEEAELYADINAISKLKEIPLAAQNELKKISENKNINFYDVKKYLDEISVETLMELEKDVDEIIMADKKITPEEKEARNMFMNYLYKRRFNL